MSEMLSRAVTAFMASAYKQLGEPYLIHDPHFAGRFELAGVDVASAMRAAIEAMREPTPGMEDAAYALVSPDESVGPYRAWQAMIDEALKPEQASQDAPSTPAPTRFVG